jgi:hypothetical protein
MRNTVIGDYHANGDTNIAAATRHALRRSYDLITVVTSN